MMSCDAIRYRELTKNKIYSIEDAKKVDFVLFVYTQWYKRISKPHVYVVYSTSGDEDIP